MAERFVEVDRSTPMLLPADLRDWVPEDDLVHFVIEAVKTLPSGEFVVNERGTGYAQYPPSMMLALLIYCYANGIFSSRRIERASYRDLGVRFLTGDTHPDHDTICSFRRQNEKLIAKFFVRVLELARELKLLQVGTISVDGDSKPMPVNIAGSAINAVANSLSSSKRMLRSFCVKPNEPTAKGKWIQPGCQKRSQNAKSLKPS
jgi:transposase